jgi:hypothetical protein
MKLWAITKMRLPNMHNESVHIHRIREKNSLVVEYTNCLKFDISAKQKMKIF